MAISTLGGCGVFSSSEPDAAQAVKAAKTIAQGVADNRTHVVWEGLSDRHQQEANELLHRFAEKVPSSLWGNGIRIVELWGRTLKEKREFALNCPTLRNERDRIEEHGEELSALLTKVAQSDAKDIQNLKTADVGDLLRQLDPELLAAFPALLQTSSSESSELTAETYAASLEKISTATFGLGTHAKDHATVVTTFGENQMAEIPFVKTSGRWVFDMPEETWQAQLSAANQWVDELDREELQSLSLWGIGVNIVMVAQLQQLLETKTQSEFDQLLADPNYNLLQYYFFATPKRPFATQDL